MIKKKNSQKSIRRKILELEKGILEKELPKIDASR